MQRFDHIPAASAGEAVALLTGPAAAESRIIAGGTDLLTQMKAGLLAPCQLIDLKPAHALRYLRFAEDGALQIGATTRLADLERNAEVRQRLPLLSQAVRDAATPQLRAMATVAGNLLQRPRCWYFRGDYGCWLKGGAECFARDGENRYHAIFDESPCVAVHPSDLAPALIALRAEVVIEGPHGMRMLPVEQLLQPPTEAERVEYRLAPNEVIVEIYVPPQPAGAHGVYSKIMERQAWAFALVSAAAQMAVRDGRVEQVRLVLGGVANTPRRITATEELLVGQKPTPKRIAQVAERAIADTQPLAHNSYKVPMAREAARRALLAAAGVSDR